MDKDCCKVRGSLCGMRGSHHQHDCTCTGCMPTTRIIDRMSLASMGAIIDWADKLSLSEMKEFRRMVEAY